VLGRWSLTRELFATPVDAKERSRALAELLLERHGVVTRAAVAAEGIPGGFGGLYGALRDLETLGACRRGLFVDGAGGAQFALAGAVERLRELREAPDEPELVVLAASDPANPYGAALPWPERAAGRASRSGGAYVVLEDGGPVLYAERGGRTLLSLDEPTPERLGRAVGALAAEVRQGRPRRLTVERLDGEPVLGSPADAILRAAGFSAGPRRLVLRADRRA
jgi:ATP-dependent Lhr-like helicase